MLTPKILLLEKARIVKLDGDSYFLRDEMPQALFVAASPAGEVTVLNHQFEAKRLPVQPGAISAICAHPSEPMLAFIHGNTGRLSVMDFNGTCLYEQQTLNLQKHPSHISDDCYFDETGNYLWRTVSLEGEEECEVEVQLWDTHTWTIAARVKLQDPFGGSHCSFYSTGRPQSVALWLAAGQDGQQIYWLNRRARGFSCEIEPSLKNTTPPCFGPRSDEFLIVDNSKALCRVSYPLVRPLGICEKPPDEDEHFEVALEYLTENIALTSTYSERMYLLNVAEMKLMDEIVIAGPAPESLDSRYARLARTGEGYIRPRSFRRCGDTMVFIHPVAAKDSPSDWKDLLLCFTVEAIVKYCRG